MYVHSKDKSNIKPNMSKCSQMYKNSPFYKGRQMWNDLTAKNQKSVTMQDFRKVGQCIMGMKRSGDFSKATVVTITKGMHVQIAAKKDRPSTCLLITGRSQVPATAGSSESDHSGAPPAKFHWSGT